MYGFTLGKDYPILIIQFGHKLYMRHVQPFFFRKRARPHCLRFWTNGDVLAKAFEFLEIATVKQFVIFPTGR